MGEVADRLPSRILPWVSFPKNQVLLAPAVNTVIQYRLCLPFLLICR